MAGKTDLANHLTERTGISKSQANSVVDATTEFIADALASGERVALPGFGSFSISERAAREGRNPATGKTIRIPASKVARFKPGKELKDRLNR